MTVEVPEVYDLIVKQPEICAATLVQANSHPRAVHVTFPITTRRLSGSLETTFAPWFHHEAKLVPSEPLLSLHRKVNLVRKVFHYKRSRIAPFLAAAHVWQSGMSRFSG